MTTDGKSTALGVNALETVLFFLDLQDDITVPLRMCHSKLRLYNFFLHLSYPATSNFSFNNILALCNRLFTVPSGNFKHAAISFVESSDV